MNKAVVVFLFSYFMASLVIAQGPPLSLQLKDSILVLNESGLQKCTAFRVTPDGYYLTALHCLSDCLVDAKLAEQSSSPALGLSNLLVVKSPGSLNAVCPRIKLDNQDTPIEIVATGAALSSYDGRFISDDPTYFSALQQAKWSDQGNDFALIKVISQQSLPCLKLGQTAQPFPLIATKMGGEFIRAIGFPGGTSSLSTVRGQVYLSPTDSQSYRNTQAPEDKAWIVSMASGDDVLFANTTISPGQSGGPVLAESDGSVIGVVSGLVYANAELATTQNDMIATRLFGANGAFSKLPQKLTQMILEKNHSCN
jgi:hypothetical protein